MVYFVLPRLVAIGIAVGNTLEALIGEYCLRRFAEFHNSLDRLRDVFSLNVTARTASKDLPGTYQWAAGFVDLDRFTTRAGARFDTSTAPDRTTAWLATSGLSVPWLRNRARTDRLQRPRGLDADLRRQDAD